MDMRIKDVAELLNVSESTVRRWLADGKIPAYRINQQYRFNRDEVENWLMRKQDIVLADASSGKNAISESLLPAGNKVFSLYRAINKGGVLSDVPGSSKEEVIRSGVNSIALHLHLDKEVLTELLLDRERLQPTSLNNGIGIPHTRDFLLSDHHDVVTVAFPKTPLEYNALDGQPVHTLFFLFACEDKRHLNLLAKIAHLSSYPPAVEFLRKKPSKEALLHFIKEWEGETSGFLK